MFHGIPKTPIASPLLSTTKLSKVASLQDSAVGLEGVGFNVGLDVGFNVGSDAGSDVEGFDVGFDAEGFDEAAGFVLVIKA